MLRNIDSTEVSTLEEGSTERWDTIVCTHSSNSALVSPRMLFEMMVLRKSLQADRLRERTGLRITGRSRSSLLEGGTSSNVIA